MKVGLITIYKVPNYGSVLQAFATQKSLELMGIDCDVINYNYPNEWHFQRGLIKPKKGFKSWLHKILGIRPYDRKVNYLSAFVKKYLNETKLYLNFEDLKDHNWDDYDALIVGSDQVWNYRFLKGDPTFLLSFYHGFKPKISIASSFAQKVIPLEHLNNFKTALSEFKAISVREINGIEIIKQQMKLDKDVRICLDPTLLLSRDQWLSLKQLNNKCSNTKPYILLYLLNYAFNPCPYIYQVAHYFKEQKGFEVFALEGYTTPNNCEGLVMKNRTDSSVFEFLSLFANASLVITSSFHGTAFALNFGIPLVSVVPDGSDDRQTSLVKRLGVNNCIVHMDDEISAINPYYDVLEEQNKLQIIRNEDLKWIKEVLNF